MTEKQSKVAKAAGQILAACLIALAGAITSWQMKPASADSYDGVTKEEMEKAISAVNVARIADIQAITSQLDALDNKIDSKFEKLSDSQQQTREAVAGLSADIRNLSRDRWRNGEREVQK